MHLSFAHMSDPHIPLPPVATPQQLSNKRLLGYLSWYRKRQFRHRPEILASLVQDITTHATDHILVAGDLVNIALPHEFEAAKDWLKNIGPPRDVTVIPGNHDAYIQVPVDQGIGQWTPWMRGDEETETSFPFVRRRGPVAFVMLSTATPTPPLMASGALGSHQLKKLETILTDLGKEEVFRVVVLHHPPEDRPTKWRKALRDRAAFRDVLARTGAELVLHGHQHHRHFGVIPGPDRKVPVLGVPSASMALNAKAGTEAGWNLIEVTRDSAGWQLSVTVRGLTDTGFGTLGRWTLQHPSS